MGQQTKRFDLRSKRKSKAHLLLSGVGDGGDSLRAKLDGSGLPLVVGSALDLPLLLKGVNDVLVAPSDLVRETLDGAG